MWLKMIQYHEDKRLFGLKISERLQWRWRWFRRQSEVSGIHNLQVFVFSKINV